MADSERLTGEVKFFKDDLGYGFITGDDGREVFVHWTGIEGEGYRTLTKFQRVEYEVTQTPKGPQAERVRVS